MSKESRKKFTKIPSPITPRGIIAPSPLAGKNRAQRNRTTSAWGLFSSSVRGQLSTANGTPRRIGISFARWVRKIFNPWKKSK